MSLYGQYIKERENKNIIENEVGFATFYFNQDCCYIEDIFVVPEQRKSHQAARFADEISIYAKEKGCKWLIGSVKPSASGSTESLKVLLAYGFKLSTAYDDQIYFKKDLGE